MYSVFDVRFLFFHDIRRGISADIRRRFSAYEFSRIRTVAVLFLCAEMPHRVELFQKQRCNS